jgi:hypothetical protein
VQDEPLKPSDQARTALSALLHPPIPEPLPTPVMSGYENIPTIANSSITQLQQQLAATQRALQAVRNEAAAYEHDLTELRWRCVTLGVPTNDTAGSSQQPTGSLPMRPPRHIPSDNESYGFGAALLSGSAAPPLPGNSFVMARPPAAVSGSSFGGLTLGVTPAAQPVPYHRVTGAAIPGGSSTRSPALRPW